MYEYSSSSSSQEFFSTFWNLVDPFKSAHFSLNLGTKNLVKIGTQQGVGVGGGGGGGGGGSQRLLSLNPTTVMVVLLLGLLLLLGCDNDL